IYEEESPMFGTALESVMGVLLIALGIIAALVLLAYTGEVGLILISRLVHVFIAPSEWILHVVLHALDSLGGQIETVLQHFRDRLGHRRRLRTEPVKYAQEAE